MFCVGSPPYLNECMVGVVYTSKQTFPSSFCQGRNSLYLAPGANIAPSLIQCVSVRCCVYPSSFFQRKEKVNLYLVPSFPYQLTTLEKSWKETERAKVARVSSWMVTLLCVGPQLTRQQEGKSHVFCGIVIQFPPTKSFNFVN